VTGQPSRIKCQLNPAELRGKPGETGSATTEAAALLTVTQADSPEYLVAQHTPLPLVSHTVNR
jgi:hypothetical protein